MAAELKSDLEELRGLLVQSKRPNVRKLLEKEVERVDGELQKQQQAEKKDRAAAQSTAAANSARPVKKLTSFAYDESDKFVKLYYTLAGVQKLSADAVDSQFTDDSFRVTIRELDGVDYVVEARGFSHPIDADKSTVKLKTDSVLVMLKKEHEGTTWSKLLKLGKSTKMETPNIDPSADPQASMMNMMQKMYEEGDDEMKRTIKKAMYESQQKKGAGGAGDFEF
ncbi:Calcyclin-binding protein [Aphelenchoides fujianensis]|nr:Calcyclin-binding protein [Aphelenchoides fujianensis]